MTLKKYNTERKYYSKRCEKQNQPHELKIYELIYIMFRL